MRADAAMMAAIFLSGALLCGCGGGASATAATTPTVQTAAPGIVSFTDSALQNGAVMAVLGFTGSGSPAPGSVLYYTVDGTTPTTSSTRYLAPFLVASNLTIKAVAQAPGDSVSNVASQSFTPNIPSGTLVWSDEFSNSTGSNAQPSSMIWTYDTGNSGFGNNELENYCAWGSNASPCSTANPNAYVGTDGFLHIVARQPSAGVYTSARLKTEGLFSFQYGRIEARIKLPEGQGMWPAFWLLGNNVTTVEWPACGELDVMEHIDGSNPQNEGFDWVQGSIHGSGLNGGIQFHPAGFSAAGWHTYGMIWSKGQIQYYVDDPANVYATFNSSTQAGTWPFDSGPEFVILNLAVGGSWPGSPDSTTVFPAEMLVDSVRVYSN
jgi:beta-glucanase (GH16 family)